MPSRLRTRLDELKARNEKALGLFLTNGFPDPASTLPILRALDANGVDFIELGMPFSDPLGEGLPIQRSSERALKYGVSMTDAFETVRAFRSESETPVLLMGYINPVYRYGISNFCRDARSSGVDGLILPDVPLDETNLIADVAAATGLDLVSLIAPNTPTARVKAIDEKATGFVYAVSIAGLTGAALDAVDTISAYLERARGLVQRNPLLVGFGIKSYADTLRLSKHTDGCIVGSALVSLVESLWSDDSLSEEDRLARIGSFVRHLKTGKSDI
jgi:tryptophan synthase alpha chain